MSISGITANQATNNIDTLAGAQGAKVEKDHDDEKEIRGDKEVHATAGEHDEVRNEVEHDGDADDAIGLTVLNTLASLGVSPAASQAPAGATGPSAAGHDDKAGEAVEHAVHAFMHSLFNALNQGSTASSAGAANGAAEADDLSTALFMASAAYGSNPGVSLQGLADSLNANSAGAGQNAAPNPVLDQLGADFQALLSAINGGAPADPSAQQPTLQTFLQSLSQSIGALNPVGTSVATAV